ncbi:2-methylisocitrate lyase [Roseibium aquae]|uniref:2-methylisocitrate lyase n=1 Tax=Roseibium aquae TaxID=1323746 RepID=A0A916WX66_9HYPH|nr:isocitrate lyase/phosphoenolpyruvate mutase family protein [Roseibium aquae]GGB40929.1 2-methylisocitrate lyase [Roseibium aquae]
MATIEARRERFRELHGKRDAFVMPNPYDRGTTRILEGLRFEALATTSAGHAFTLGLKDAEGLIDRNMALAHAQGIVEATTLPVNGDFENGYGDTPEDVAETIKGAIEIGLAGCSIEDFGPGYPGSYYPLDLAVDRIKSAASLKNRLAPNFVLTARSEAPIDSEPALTATIDRLKAFANAGADCVYAPDLTRPEHITAVLSAVDKPLNILAGRKSFHLTRKELRELGVSRISIGSGLARVAYGAFVDAAEDILDSGTFGCFDRSKGFLEFDPFLEGRKRSHGDG